MKQPTSLTSQVPPLAYFKVMPEAFVPEWATETSACFDLKACLPARSVVKAFTKENVKVEVTVSPDFTITIPPSARMMIPTGLIFDIPFGYSVRLHARSGLALKQALVLANQEGVIDSDYVEPTFVVLINLSDETLTVKHGDRIAQAELMPDIAYNLEEVLTRPQQKTDRIGGFGSTGK